MLANNKNQAFVVFITLLFMPTCAAAHTRTGLNSERANGQSSQVKNVDAASPSNIPPAKPVAPQVRPPSAQPEMQAVPLLTADPDVGTAIPKDEVTPPATDARQNRPEYAVSKIDTENTLDELVDITGQYTEVIAGVPIIENPTNCDQGNLEIGIIVKNIPKTKGVIVADLHDDVQENFLVWDKVVLRVRVPAQKGEVSFCIPITRPGDYAIAVYHDKNSNKKFDKNFLGIPTERFGMSSNPRFGRRSPKYDEAVFTVPTTGTSIQIKLRKASDVLGRQD